MIERDEDYVRSSSDQEGTVFATEAVIRRQCKKHNGYSTPDLNEKLYLNHLGLSGLSPALNSYVNCTALYLDHNALHDLTDLAGLVHLKSLYLSHNSLDSFSTWPMLPVLEHLDVSNNYLKSLDGIGRISPMLRTLLASHNRVDRLGDALQPLTELTSLDLSYNHLESDPLGVLGALAGLKHSLATCILSGNPVTQGLPHYRKRLLQALPLLRYLDTRPVTAAERERAEAFARGGPEAERAARAALQEREHTEKNKRNAYFEAFRSTVQGRAPPPPSSASSFSCPRATSPPAL